MSSELRVKDQITKQIVTITKTFILVLFGIEVICYI